MKELFKKTTAFLLAVLITTGGFEAHAVSELSDLTADRPETVTICIEELSMQEAGPEDQIETCESRTSGSAEDETLDNADKAAGEAPDGEADKESAEAQETAEGQKAAEDPKEQEESVALEECGAGQESEADEGSEISEKPAAAEEAETAEESEAVEEPAVIEASEGVEAPETVERLETVEEPEANEASELCGVVSGEPSELGEQAGEAIDSADETPEEKSFHAEEPESVEYDGDEAGTVTSPDNLPAGWTDGAEEAGIGKEGNGEEDDEDPDGLNPGSGSATVVEDAKIGEDPGNSRYSSITFNFSDGEKEYQCTINGLRSASVTEEGLQAFCEGVADAFLNGRKFVISNTESNPGNLKADPIDAEKMNIVSEDVSLKDILMNRMDSYASGMPYGDYAQCWAASAADMLAYSGWGDAGSEYGSDEDRIFSYYANKYFDQASRQEQGIKWFFDGVNIAQSYDNNGDASYYDWYDLNSAVNGTWAQRRYPGFDTPGVTPENYREFLAKDIRIADYAAESFLKEYDLGDESVDAISDMIIDAVAQGNAVGITANYLKEDRSGGAGAHALTVFGFVRDALVTGLDALKALFLSDSDSDQPGGLKNPGGYYSSAATEPERKQAENKYTMYLIEPAKDYSGRDSFEIVDYVPESAGLDAVFATVTILESASKADDNDREKAGTRNPVLSVDLVPTNTYVSNAYLTGTIRESHAGEVIVLSGVIQNCSLNHIDPEIKPVVKCTYTILKDGEPYDTYNVTSYLSSTGYRAGGYTFTNHYYVFREEGEYTISYSVDGLFDGDGNRIDEAYTVNNDCRFPYAFYVKPGLPYSGDVLPAVSSLRAYAVDYTVFGLGKHAVIELSDGVKFTELYFNGLPVGKDLYELNDNGDGTWSVEFTPEYIKKIGTGHHIFDLKTSDGETIILLVHIA